MRLSPLGLGCWQFSRGKGMVGGFWGAVDDAVVREIVALCLQGGINWFDTAEVYGGGESEKALSAALNAAGSLADEAYVATKWWPVMRTAGSIPATIDKRLESLSGRRIDLYQVHQPFSFSSVSSEMKEMAKLAEQGKIRHIGVSNFSAKQMSDADKTLRQYGLRLASNQVKYSMLDRSIERNGILEAAKELDIAIIAYSPLAQGILTGKFHQNPALISNLSGMRKRMGGISPKKLEITRPLINKLTELAAKYEATPARIALNWTINAHGETVFAIPGASRASQAEENVKAMTFRLTDSELAELSEMADRVAQK